MHGHEIQHNNTCCHINIQYIQLYHDVSSFHCIFNVVEFNSISLDHFSLAADRIEIPCAQ